MAKCQNCDHGMVLVPYPDKITDEGVVSGGDDYEVCPCCNGDWKHCPNCVDLPLADNVSTIRDEKPKRPPQ